MIKFITNLLNKISSPSSSKEHWDAQKISRNNHHLSRKNISDNALKVLYRLSKNGFDAYLVGGCVRDLLLNGHPKDFDIVTNALPEQVKKLFRNSFIIGRRFRLVHVRFAKEIVEVATFRKPREDSSRDHMNEHGMLVHDNHYGTIEQDVIRRDFTVNALYYNIVDFSILDFVGGMQDLEQKKLCLIGDPKTRCQEDPVRILRAIRFAAKLDFTIAEEVLLAIKETRDLIKHVSSARLFDEFIKLFLSGYSKKTFDLLLKNQLLEYLFPSLNQLLMSKNDNHDLMIFLTKLLDNTDQRISEQKTVNPAFLLAALLWYPRVGLVNDFTASDSERPLSECYQKAEQKILEEQLTQILIPKRFLIIVKEIWHLQRALEQRRPSRVLTLVYLPRFRAAYDFLLLRTITDRDSMLIEIAQWWERFQTADDEERHQLIRQLNKGKKKRKYKKSQKATMAD